MSQKSSLGVYKFMFAFSITFKHNIQSCFRGHFNELTINKKISLKTAYLPSIVLMQLMQFPHANNKHHARFPNKSQRKTVARIKSSHVWALISSQSRHSIWNILKKKSDSSSAGVKRRSKLHGYVSKEDVGCHKDINTCFSLL